jgi:hypothetical protein
MSQEKRRRRSMISGGGEEERTQGVREGRGKSIIKIIAMYIKIRGVHTMYACT